MATIDLNDLKNKSAGEGQAPIPVETAFLVIIRGPGIIQASTDINTPISPQREVTFDEVQMACEKVAGDVQAQKTAQLVTMEMQRVAAYAQEQMATQQLAQSLKI